MNILVLGPDNLRDFRFIKKKLCYYTKGLDTFKIIKSNRKHFDWILERFCKVENINYENREDKLECLLKDIQGLIIFYTPDHRLYEYAIKAIEMNIVIRKVDLVEFVGIKDGFILEEIKNENNSAKCRNPKVGRATNI